MQQDGKRMLVWYTAFRSDRSVYLFGYRGNGLSGIPHVCKLLQHLNSYESHETCQSLDSVNVEKWNCLLLFGIVTQRIIWQDQTFVA